MQCRSGALGNSAYLRRQSPTIPLAPLQRTGSVLVADLRGVTTSASGAVLDEADAFLCEERERARWLAELAAHGRVTAGRQREDPELRSLIDDPSSDLVERILASPGRWRALRGTTATAPITQDVQWLLGARAAELDAARRLADEQRAMMEDQRRLIASQQQRIAEQEASLAQRVDEIDALWKQVHELQAVVEHQEQVLSMIRKTGVMPFYRAAKRVSSWIGARRPRG